MKLFFTRVPWKVVLHKKVTFIKVNLFELRKNNCAILSTKLNQTKEKTASNKSNSQDGYFVEHQRSI